MEKKHGSILREKFAEALNDKQIHCLGIPDDYEFMDEDLVSLLEAAVAALVQS